MPKRRSQQIPQQLKLAARADVLRFIEKAAGESKRAETGGILMGFHNPDGILVTAASSAGPSPRASSTGFVRDTEYCRDVLAKEFAASGADYVGEWHSHIVNLRRPSVGDLLTLAGIMMDHDYDFPSFAMILAVVFRDGGTELRGYVIRAAHGAKHHFLVSEVTIAEETSG